MITPTDPATPAARPAAHVEDGSAQDAGAQAQAPAPALAEASTDAQPPAQLTTVSHAQTTSSTTPIQDPPPTTTHGVPDTAATATTVAPPTESASQTGLPAHIQLDTNAPYQPQDAQDIAVDEHDDDLDSSMGTDDDFSDTTSIASSLIRGHIENGRKYSTLTDKYWGPSDEKQFETMDAGHFLYLILDSDRENPLFRAPIKDPRHILDIGTGSGTWAVDTADKFPGATVYGVDLFPPPPTWVPPNCYLEVDDVQQDWTWKQKFDLIHLRLLLGGFTDDEWTRLYSQCFQNLAPGGWIEQVELDVRVMADDDSLPADSLLAGWGPNFLGCADRSGRSLATQTTMKKKIKEAGFVDVQEYLYKCPIGTWPKNKILKEAGRINLQHWSSGLEGWAMWLLTKHGAPVPWSADEVRVYVAKVRQELKNPNLHIYHYTRRVWGRRP